MRLRLLASVALVLGIAVGGLFADEQADEVAKKMKAIADLGPGVHKIKKDNKGRIVSCVIVGQSRISTVLGKSKGLETARTRARLAAVAEFRKWLKEKVRVYEKAADETITLMEGKEGAGKDEVTESGKAVETTTTRYESIAEGIVRGMQVLHVEVNGDDKNYTLVLGWDAATAKATKRVDRDLKDDAPPAKEKAATAGEKKVDKKIDSKKATSGDAKRFID